MSGYFRPWKKSGLWPRIDEKLGQEVGAAGARHKETSAGMIDNQAVKNDRKRGSTTIQTRNDHLLVDRSGLIEAYQSKLRTDQIQMVPNGYHQKWPLRPLD